MAGAESLECFGLGALGGSGSASPNLQASLSTSSVPSCEDTRRLGALGSTLLESNETDLKNFQVI